MPSIYDMCAGSTYYLIHGLRRGLFCIVKMQMVSVGFSIRCGFLPPG